MLAKLATSALPLHATTFPPYDSLLPINFSGSETCVTKSELLSCSSLDGNSRDLRVYLDTANRVHA